MRRLLAGLLLAAGLLIPTSARNTAVPDLAFIPYPRSGDVDLKPVPAVLQRIARARLKLSAGQSRLLLQQLFDDRIPALDYITAALNLDAEVTPARRQELIAREKSVDRDPGDTTMICDRIAALDVQKNELEGNPSFTEGLYRFSVLDVDAPSGRADLILIPAMYFGPSAGLKFYGRGRERFEYLGEQSGDIRRIDETPSSTVFRFQVNILDPSETGIVLNFAFDRSRRSWMVTRQYYAQQTEMPGPFSLPAASRTVRVTELRTGPGADDGPGRTDRDEEMVTTTLRGNVVARFPANAGCLLLAAKREWAFCAFLPEAKPLECSLYHDLDHTLDRTRKQIGAPPLPSYICGWVRRDALRADH